MLGVCRTRVHGRGHEAAEGVIRNPRGTIQALDRRGLETGS